VLDGVSFAEVMEVDGLHTFVRQPVLKQGLDLAGALDERRVALGAFALRGVERKVGVGVEGLGCRRAVVACRSAAAATATRLDVSLVILVGHGM
jgi:hypothetical protein